MIEPASADKIGKMHDYTGHRSLIPAAKFCEVSGLSSQALDKVLLAKRIFAVELQGQVSIPGFFLDRRYNRRQMASACKLLGGLQGGSKLQLFPTPKGSLGGQTRLDALEVLKFAAVRRDAHGFAEQQLDAYAQGDGLWREQKLTQLVVRDKNSLISWQPAALARRKKPF